MTTASRKEWRKVVTQEEAPAKDGSVADLLRAVSGFVPTGMESILRAVKDNLLLVEVADTPEGEKVCAEKIADPFREWGGADLARAAVRSCVQELSNYRREVREQVITAALLRVRDLVAKAEQLKALLPQVQKSLLHLEARAQALSHVEATIKEVGGEINVDFLEEVIRPMRVEGKTKVGVLRKDPRLGALMNAYDLALQIIMAY